MSENGDAPALTVKEWCVRMDAKLDSLVVQVAAKADTAAVGDMLKRITVLEIEGAGTKAVGAYRKWLIGIGMLALAQGATIAGLLVRLGGH